MPAKKPGKKMPPPRVSILAEDSLAPAQRALLESIRSGPRGGSTTIRGPFAVFLHAPAFGELAQQLGGYCRFKTGVPPRLSEFAILTTARLWRAQYEWWSPERRARDLRFHPGALQDAPRERSEFCTRARRAWRCGDCRVGWHSRLLRLDIDDPQRVSHVPSAGRDTSVQGDITRNQPPAGPAVSPANSP